MFWLCRILCSSTKCYEDLPWGPICFADLPSIYWTTPAGYAEWRLANVSLRIIDNWPSSNANGVVPYKGTFVPARLISKTLSNVKNAQRSIQKLLFSKSQPTPAVTHFLTMTGTRPLSTITPSSDRLTFLPQDISPDPAVVEWSVFACAVPRGVVYVYRFLRVLVLPPFSSRSWLRSQL